MKKKILIIGNGANAYALAKRLSYDNDVYVAPGSDTIKEFATCLDIREDSVNELLDFVLENDIDLTIPISQKALSVDICKKFADNKQNIFGPTYNACEVLSNKTLAKKMLYKLRIPTPKFGIFEKSNVAIDYLKNQTIPFVIKNNDSNSAAVITSILSAKKIIESAFQGKNKRIIIEDYVYGTPFSFYSITDGYKALPIGSSIIYKHSLSGEGGQLTSGMGACVPNYKLSLKDEYYIMDNIIYPTIEYLEKNGTPYLGILGVNGIYTQEGKIQILGWQTFTQDSDTDGILNLLDEDLISLMQSCIIGSFSDEVNEINLRSGYSVSLVLHSNKNDNKENVIKGICNDSDRILTAFYPNVKKNRYFEYEAQKGPNIVLTSYASCISKASEYVYRDAKDIEFDGMFYRNDICKTEL